jgi:hypothetical protein
MQSSYLGGKHREADPLSAGEIVLCLLLPMIGAIVGLVRLGQRRSKGGLMLLLSGLMMLLWMMVRLMR